MQKIRLTLMALTISALSAEAFAAGGMAGQLNAQMTLSGGCAVSGAGSSGSSGTNFGTLDFGVQPSTFSGVLVATASGGAGGSGGTQIVCSPDVVAMSVSVSAGNNPGQGSAVGAGGRAMRLGTSSYLPYEVYSDSAMTTAYPTGGSAVGVPLAGTGTAIALPIFGRIQKTQASAMPSGTYSDVLQVTLSW